MSQPKLFPDVRACVCCGATAVKGKREPGAPNILAVSFTMTRKGTGKSRTEGAGSVRVCEACLVRARVGSLLANGAARRLVAAVLERLSGCYSGLVSEDAA